MMHHKTNIFLLFLFLIPFVGFGQSTVFIKSYGNTGYDYGTDIKQTLDTGYIATGSSSSFGSADADVFLMKVDSAGNFKWSYNYGGTGSDWGESVIVASDSSFAVGGYTNSFGAGGFDFYLVRTSINGDPLWEKTYGGSNWDRAFSMVQLPDSGFVMVGETYSFGAGELDMYIVRTDKMGEELWSTTYGGEADDYATDVLLHGDSIVVVGSTSSEGAGDEDGIMLKYHLNGELGSKIVIGGPDKDFFNAVDRQEDYYIMGGSRSYNHFGDCDCGLDFWMYKVDTADLSVIADTTWYGEQLGEDVVNDICLNPANHIFYAGTTTSWGSVDISEGFTDAFFSKLLSNYYTAFDYITNFGEKGNDDIQALDFCYDEGVVGIGSSPFNATGGHNVMIVRNDRFNSAGSFNILDAVYENITLSTAEIDPLVDFKVYPTLFTESIQVNGIENSYMLQIHDLNGKLVYQKQSNEKVHQLQHLMPGYYLLTIQYNQTIYNQKIVKQ